MSLFATNGTTGTGTDDGYIIFDNVIQWGGGTGSVSVKDGKGISPQLYFRYAKSKFKKMESNLLDKEIKLLEKGFDAFMANNQKAAAEKILKEYVMRFRESMIKAKGVSHYIEKSVLNKHKNNIRGGHISDTDWEYFTRVIPKRVIERKKEFDGLFDSFVIYHYYNPDQKDVKKMDETEKSKMKDPVLFGRINETDRLYFIADWDDEFCDLTFEEMIGVVIDDECRAKTKESMSL